MPVDNQKNEHKNEINSATLAVIAGLITTLGDALSTIAAIMALEESQQEKNANRSANPVNLHELERQVKYLTREVQKLKSGKRC